MIRKFKNGNIVLKMDNQKDFDIDQFYHEEMFWSDLYFNQVDGYMYLMDWNKDIVYDFSDCYINILLYLKERLEGGLVRLYPMPKKEGDILIQELFGGDQ